MAKKVKPQYMKNQEFSKKHSPEVASKKLKKLYKDKPELKGKKFKTIG